jgi:hypothetical protein
MVDRYAKFATVNLTTVAARIESKTEENVIQFPRFIHVEKKNDLGVTLSS